MTDAYENVVIALTALSSVWADGIANLAAW